MRWCLVLKFREEVKGKHLQPSRRPQLLVAMEVVTKHVWPSHTKIRSTLLHGEMHLRAFEASQAAEVQVRG